MATNLPMSECLPLTTVRSTSLAANAVERNLDKLEKDFLARYPAEEEILQRLYDAPDVGSGEATNIERLDRLAEDGFEKCLARLGEEGRTKRLVLVSEFVQFGAKAALLTGSQRGGDFLNNQLRGQWAENVVMSMDVGGLAFVPFGPSAAAMPGEQDHRQTIMTFKAITLLEGKRPDVLAFETSEWDALEEAQRNRASEWPTRLLDAADEELVRKARAAVEVKNSTWHYETRRAFGGGSLSITVKEEEVHAIEDWQEKTGVPVLFFQVLFDELYAMSFRRMCDAIDRGFLYSDGDLVTDDSQGAGGKVWHRFHLDDQRHRCGEVAFPDESEAVIRILESGSVVPYIAYAPAEARCTNPAAISAEINY